MNMLAKKNFKYLKNKEKEKESLIFEKKLKIFFSVMKSNFNDIFKILFFLNIFENNLSMFKRELPAEKDTMFCLYVTSHA